MATLTSATHNLSGGCALKYTVLCTIKKLGKPTTTAEVTTAILGVKKGARGWYETHSRIRYTFNTLAQMGCIRTVGESRPRKWEYVHSMEDRHKGDNARSAEKVKAGRHTIRGIDVIVDDKGIICEVVSENREIVRRVHYPNDSVVLERVDPVGLAYNYVCRRIYRTRWWEVVERRP